MIAEYWWLETGSFLKGIHFTVGQKPQNLIARAVDFALNFVSIFCWHIV